MKLVDLLSPAGVVESNEVPLARRLEKLDGRVVGLLDNSKSGTTPFLDRVEELLRAEHGVAGVVRFKKQAAALPAPGEMLESLARECDVVVNGIAD
ncbi:MAG: hypothetical protein HY329_14690 [Chloroflexi bacterium]|nr:hypothetical protein [Chloroflexota bacterium]